MRVASFMSAFGLVLGFMLGLRLLIAAYGLDALRLKQVAACRGIVEFGCFALDDFQRSGRTDSYAIAKSIAELFLDEFRLAVDDLYRTFGAANDTIAAAVAEFFVDFNDFTYHVDLL